MFTLDTANEVYTARYTHETIALAFALTQEAMEDNLHDRLVRHTRALARSMAQQTSAKVMLNSKAMRLTVHSQVVMVRSFVQLITH